MERSRLGKSELFVAPIGMGCWAYGGGTYWGDQSQSDVNEVVHKALDGGINLFDTAEMYNNGESETSLGLALKGRRHEAVICSKISPSNTNSVTLRAHCEASLKRLGTDYLDLYMVHWPINPISIKHFTKDSKIINNPPTVEEAFDTLMALKREGKIRSLGLSNFGITQMDEVLKTGAEIIVNEMPYNIVSRAIEKAIIPFCIKNDIAIIGSMALQQGLLAGIYEKVDDVPHSQAHSRHYRNERGQGTSRHGGEGAEDEIFYCVKELKKLALQLGITIAQLSIAWTISMPGLKCRH